MKRKTRNLLILLVTTAFILPGTAARAAEPVDHAAWIDNLLEHGTWSEVSAWLQKSKDVIELGDASIIIEESGNQTITESCFETEEP